MVIRPIFIGGSARSGTTFLGSMLGNTPQAVVTPESQFKVGLLSEGSLQSVDAWRLRLWGNSYTELSQGMNGRALLDEMVVQYARRTGKAGFRFWVDHTPNNLSYIKLLLAHYPEAKFIHIIRDGRAVCASTLPLSWGPFNAYDMAPWWMMQLSPGLAGAVAYPNNVAVVRYEDLAANPERELKRLAQFCGISFDDSMKTGGGFVVPDYTRSQHSLVGSAPQPGRVDRWRGALGKREIEIFESRTGNLLDYLGYEPDFSSPRPATHRERLAYKLSPAPFAGRIKAHLRRARATNAS